MNLDYDPPLPIRILLKQFYQKGVLHRTGIACSIEDVEFDMLFDTGTNAATIHPDTASRLKLHHFPMLRDSPAVYRVPLKIARLPPMYIDLYVDCDEHRTLLPPRIFTEKYSINFAQIDNQYFATFKPKQSGGITYKTLLNKHTAKTWPSGTPGFDFLIGGSLERASFDTGTPISVVHPPIARKIRINQYTPATDLFGAKYPGYFVPISLPGVVSEIFVPTYVSNIYPVNIVSAVQFLDNGIEFTLNEDSASFSTVAA